jgi:prenylcysteine oxidase/farnesylcysteine lyase
LVEGEINPSAFGFGFSNMTAANFFISPLSSVISVTLLVPTEFEDDDLKWLPRVWKIFSTRPLHDEEIDEMFLSRRATQTFDWLAYPHYSTEQRRSLGNFTLHPGLYHINGIEWAASAIEMSLIGAKNVGNLAQEYWADRERLLAEAIPEPSPEPSPEVLPEGSKSEL